MIIGTTTIGESGNTLGMNIIVQDLMISGYTKIVEVDKSNAASVDILLISMYWVDQVIKYPKWLVSRGYEGSNKALYNISLKYSEDLKKKDGRAFENIKKCILQSGVDMDLLINGSKDPPQAHITPHSRSVSEVA